MTKQITYKKQGDGLDSWIVRYYDDNEVLINQELVYKNPNLTPIEEEKIKYDQRVLDGQDAYLMLMAELRITSKQYNLHRDVNKFIEEKLELVKSQVINGQWISAREKLDLVIVEGYLTQELYDRIKLELDTYISENY